MRRLFGISMVAGVLFAGGIASLAYAASAWTAPIDGAAVVTAYGVRYDGQTHHGIDIGAAPGTPVAAPAAGRVVFAGQVPADGGGTCGAVTIELADGLRLSLLPLGEVFVDKDGSVDPGEVVGTLAAAGDDSASVPHLHLGLRSTYVDPTGFLAVAPAEAPAEAPEPSGAIDADIDGGQVSPGARAASSDAPVAAGSSAHASARAITDEGQVGALATGAGAVAVARATSVRHPVPEGSDAPALSQIVRAQTAQTGSPEWQAVVANAAGPHPVTNALVGIGSILVLAGSLGLTRQFAHGRAW